MRAAVWPALAGLVAIVAAAAAVAQDNPRMALATTPTIERTGILDDLLYAFQSETGIRVEVRAATETNPYEVGRKGEVDALLVTESERAESIVHDGFGVDAQPVFYTDYVLVGPEHDPAGCAGARNILDALQRIAAAHQPFVSRGDDSPVYEREASLWHDAGIDPLAPGATWYHRVGMGADYTLHAASSGQAYTLARRVIWARFKKLPGLRVVSEGDPRLYRYVISIRINPERFEYVNRSEAEIWARWLASPAAQQLIAAYRLEDEPVFFAIDKRRQAAALRGTVR